MSVLGLCGIVCSDCSMYGRECSGCVDEAGSSGYSCEVYQCVTRKGLSTCIECIEDRKGCAKVEEHLDLCPLYVLKGMRFVV